MKRLLHELLGRPELAMALILMGIVAVLVVPLGRLMLDILTVVSITGCLLVLLVAVRVRTAVDLLTFPALLLITTMLRLGLNVASTKMILLEGRAGHVVETIGRVVMGENLLVGLCVFAIVSVVQFLVVAKGADRVAEVAARFSLDAMPGKQMSIEAELRAGALTSDQASGRRDQLDIESRFFGGMDGAMKFVKGDAIAGLVITVVNIVGGLANGMLYQGMSASVALKRYATLSVGDAMVAQIPSFMLAVAAGLVTTRVTSSRGSPLDLSQQIVAEMRRHPAALSYAGLFAAGLAAIPGFPSAVLLVIGLALIVSSWSIQRSDRRRLESPTGFDFPMPSFRARDVDRIPSFIDARPAGFDASLSLTMPRVIAARIDPVRLEAEMSAVRSRLATRWGAPYPGIRCHLDPSPDHAGEPLRLRWTLNGNHDVAIPWFDDRHLHLADACPYDDGPLGIPGFPDAAWKDEPEGGAGLEHVIACVTEHLCVREQARLLTHEQFADLLDGLRSGYPQLATGLAAVVPLPVLTDTIRALLREGISLKSLPQVCDLMLSFAPLPQDANTIADMLVTGWSRRRCADVAVGGAIKVHLIDPAIERVLSDYAAAASRKEEEEPGPVVDMDAFREVRMLLTDLARNHPRGLIVLACRGSGRLLLSEIASMASCRFRVFSLRGINPRFDVQVVSHVLPSDSLRRRLEEADQLVEGIDHMQSFPGDRSESDCDLPDPTPEEPMPPPASQRAMPRWHAGAVP